MEFFFASLLIYRPFIFSFDVFEASNDKFQTEYKSCLCTRYYVSFSLPSTSLQDVINLLGITQTVAENCAILFALWIGFLGLAYVALWNTVRGLQQ